MSRSIDLNCDMGEGFGAYTLGDDVALLDYVTSANIACGFHAGDPATMRQTVQLAVQKDVAVGAHPGLPDLLGFGRRRMEVSAQDVYDLTLYQVGALDAFARAAGAALRHVKPHGALYNMAARDTMLAQAIADAVYRLDPRLVLVGLSGSELIRAGEARGLKTASEVFADRNYEADGSLTPRSHPDALIADAEQAAERVVGVVQHGRVASRQGTDVPLRAETICIHGDTPNAVEFARTIRQKLDNSGIVARSFQP